MQITPRRIAVAPSTAYHYRRTRFREKDTGKAALFAD